MPVKFVPLTKQQLIACFQPYREAFLDWEVEHDTVLARARGPLKQTIYFQSLRTGAYRPSHAVEILLPIPDGCSILHSHLDIKHRDVFPREHSAKWPQMLKAMEEQFIPPIRKPLDVAETLQFGEKEAEVDRIENINHMAGLAALNAYLGNTKRAGYWCGRLEIRAVHIGRPLGDWEVRKRQYALALQQAIDAGKGQKFVTTG